MDAALKARQLGSATARRLRIEERQLEQQQAHQARLDHKKNIMSEIRVLEGMEDESDISTPSTPGLEFDTHTPCDSSVQTPEDSTSVCKFSPIPADESKAVASTNVSKRGSKGSTTSQPQSQPKMQATLTTMADWNYDRFSVIFDTLEMEEMLRASEEESTSSGSDDDLDEYSPIEIATPILYIMPTKRPSVISIASSCSRNQSPFIGMFTAEQNKRQKRASEQLQSEISPEGFRAGEATLFQMSNSSRETIASSFNSSQVSRSVSLASHNDSLISRSYSQTSQSDQSSKSPKRKKSLPLLFGNNKSGHSRMSSLKKLVRTSTMGPPSTTNQTYASLQRQASTATLSTHFESRTSSIDLSDIQPIERPQFSLPATMLPQPLKLSIHDSVTVLPNAQSNTRRAEQEWQQNSSFTPQAMNKPTPKLRSRSGSIGLTLRTVANGIMKADASAPPMPNLPRTPTSPNPSVPSMSFFPSENSRASRLNTTVPLRVSSSHKPPQIGAVGLGLRY